jgi:hypothetical protein
VLGGEPGQGSGSEVAEFLDRDDAVLVAVGGCHWDVS